MRQARSAAVAPGKCGQATPVLTCHPAGAQRAFRGVRGPKMAHPRLAQACALRLAAASRNRDVKKRSRLPPGDGAPFEGARRSFACTWRAPSTQQCSAGLADVLVVSATGIAPPGGLTSRRSAPTVRRRAEVVGGLTPAARTPIRAGFVERQQFLDGHLRIVLRGVNRRQRRFRSGRQFFRRNGIAGEH